MPDHLNELESLKKLLERLELVLEGAGIGYWDQNLVDDSVVRNDRWYEMLGYNPQELSGNTATWKELIHPEDLAEVNEICRRHEQGKSSLFRAEHRMRTRSGDWKWVLNWGRVVERDKDGEPVRAAGIHLDITERKQAEEALRESESRFRDLADLLPQTVVELDVNADLAYINRHGLAAFGCGTGELAAGSSFFGFLVPADRDRLRQDLVRITAGEPPAPVYDYTIRRIDGTTFPALIYAQQIIRSSGPAGTRSVVVDIGERKRIEAALARADKLETVGTLAGGIAHDFNNSLTTILGNISLARMDLKDGSDIDSLLADAEAGAERARKVTQQLLTFSHGGAPMLGPGSIGDVIRHAVDPALSDTGTQAEIRLPDDLPQVELSPDQMSQVFLNLFLNSAQAMDAGGLITITGRVIKDGNSIGPPICAGTCIEITVEDEGPGIPGKDLPKIFDPFFSTRPGATGLGLATAFAIVKSHGGTIDADSEVGRGARFTIRLPATEGLDRERTATTTAPGKGSGRILVMDDNPAIRSFMEKSLRKLGYEAMLAAGGEEAVQAFTKADQPFAVVILDLTIPGGIGGVKTLNLLRELDPRVRAIVFSGYSRDPVMAEYRNHGFNGRLAKPYRIADLARVLREVIGADHS